MKSIIVSFIATGFMLAFSSCESGGERTHIESGHLQTYTCPMHPQIISDKPGSCSICGMDLVPFDKTNTAHFLTLSMPQQVLANITTDTVKPGLFSSFIQLNGRLVVDPSQTEFISSRVAGRLEKMYVKQSGERIQRGQPLYTIYSEQLVTLQQEFLVTTAQLAQFPNDSKFQQLVDAAKQKLLLYGQTETQIQQLKNKQQTNPFVTYAALADGTVSELLVTAGQYVTEGTSMMSVEHYQTVWVEADVYPAEAALVKKGDMLKVTVTGFETAPQTMKVEFIAPALQPGRQLFTIRGSIPNRQHQLKPGMQAVLEVPRANSSAAITLPVDAVIHDGNGSHVWIATGIGKFEPQMVETGTENFNQVEIKSGIQPGDVIVVSGAYLLYSEFVLKKGKNPMDGHHH